MSTNLISSGTTARQRVNLRTPDVMAAVQQQVESHYRSDIIEKIRRAGGIISVGDTTVVNFVLQPVNPPGVSCLIQPTPNPIPFQGPIPGIACMPNWVWYTLGAAVFGIIVVAVLAWSPFGGALVSGAGRGLRSLTNRGGNGRARHRGYAVPTTFTGKYR